MSAINRVCLLKKKCVLHAAAHPLPYPVVFSTFDFLLLLQRMAQIRQLVKNNSLQEAKDRASQLVLQYPIEAKIHADLGGIMYKMGDYESAVTSLLSIC